MMHENITFECAYKLLNGYFYKNPPAAKHLIIITKVNITCNLVIQYQIDSVCNPIIQG